MKTGREDLEPSLEINNTLSEARHSHNEPFHSVKSSPPAAEKIQLWKEPGPRLWHHRLCSLSHRRPGQQNRLLGDVSSLAPTQAAILNQASHLAQKAFGARAREAESGSNIYILCTSSNTFTIWILYYWYDLIKKKKKTSGLQNSKPPDNFYGSQDLFTVYSLKQKYTQGIPSKFQPDHRVLEFIIYLYTSLQTNPDNCKLHLAGNIILILTLKTILTVLGKLFSWLHISETRVCSGYDSLEPLQLISHQALNLNKD